jgi:hypothetical protein
MARKMIDCRDLPSESNCTLTIAGEPEELERAAVQHAVSVHGHTDTPEFRAHLRDAFKDDPSALPVRGPGAGADVEARH